MKYRVAGWETVSFGEAEVDAETEEQAKAMYVQLINTGLLTGDYCGDIEFSIEFLTDERK